MTPATEAARRTSFRRIHLAARGQTNRRSKILLRREGRQKIHARRNRLSRTRVRKNHPSKIRVRPGLRRSVSSGVKVAGFATTSATKVGAFWGTLE